MSQAEIVRDDLSNLRSEVHDTTADSIEDLQPHSSSFVQESELQNEALQHLISSEPTSSIVQESELPNEALQDSINSELMSTFVQEA